MLDTVVVAVFVPLEIGEVVVFDFLGGRGEGEYHQVYKPCFQTLSISGGYPPNTAHCIPGQCSNFSRGS